MLTLPRLLLETDETASLPQNLITLEEHDTSLEPERLVRLNFGAFFRKDFALFAVGSQDQNIPLTYGTHYRFIEFYPRTTQACGNEVWGALLVTDSSLGNKIRATYRGYGGVTQGDLKAYAQAVKDVPKAGSIIAYRDILMRPRGLPPKHHLHDAMDLFGMEFIRDSVLAIARTLEDAPNTQRHKVLRYHADERIANQVTVGEFEQTLRDHYRTATPNPHNESKSDFDLGNLVDVGFQDLVDPVTGAVTEGYVSPSRVRFIYSSTVSRAVRAHALLKGNVHGDTAETVGLGNVLNLPIRTGYTDSGPQGGGYASTFLNNPQLVYIGPYTANRFVQEHLARYRSGSADQALSQFLLSSNQALQQVAQLMTQFSANYVILMPKIQEISAARATVDARLGQFNPEYVEYQRLNYNSCYAQFLQQVVDHRPTTQWDSAETQVEIPLLVRGVSCWLDFSDARKLVLENKPNDTDARKLIAIEDKARPGRVFEQLSANAQPEWTYSADRNAPDTPGLQQRKVVKFTSGAQYLRLRQGPAIVIPQNATVMVLARMGTVGQTLWPLMKKPANENLAATDGLVLFDGDLRVAKLSAAGTQLTAPPGSAQHSHTVAMVMSISSLSQHAWIAGAITLDQGIYPRHLQGAVHSAASGVTVDQIGINKASLLQAGELAEIAIFNHQLSLREVKAVLHYWKRKHGGTAGLTTAVDFVQTAFEAPQSLL